MVWHLQSIKAPGAHVVSAKPKIIEVIELAGGWLW